MSNNKKNIEQCPTENLPLINPATNVCFALPEQVCTVQISKKKPAPFSTKKGSIAMSIHKSVSISN